MSFVKDEIAEGYVLNTQDNHQFLSRREFIIPTMAVLSGYTSYFEKPLDTIASELSYGQQRLLELARALLMPHKLLMLDEPTAGVNPGIRQEFKTILRNLKKEGKTVLLIEHDMEFVMNISDNIIVLNEGRVLMEGKPKDVVKDKRVLEAYLGK